MSDDEKETKAQMLDRLKRGRAAHRAAATRYTNQAKTTLALPRADVTEELQRDIEYIAVQLKRKVVDLTNVDAAIFPLLATGDQETEYQQSEYVINEIQRQIFDIEKKLESLKVTPAATTGAGPAAAPTTASDNLRLPKFELPTFTGDYSSWTSFWDIFTSSIDKNTKLSDSQKLHYLKSALQGDAAKLISPLSITDTNYAVACTTLLARFQNERAIVRSHIEAIVKYPALKTESAIALRKLMETVEEHRLALLNHNCQADTWGAILVYHVADKLDSESRKQWELSSADDNSIQEYKDLKAFVSRRCRALESAPSVTSTARDGKSTPSGIKQDDKRRLVSYITNEEGCACCGGGHRIYSCNKFRSLGVPERKTTVQTKKLCFNCLRSGHNSRDCRSESRCHSCNGNHHTLLHNPSVPSNGTPKPADHSARQESHPTRQESHPTRQESHPTRQESHPPAPQGNSACEVTGASHVILGTVVLPILRADGETLRCRALLDSGSQVTLISQVCANKLGIKPNKARMSIAGIGKEHVESRGSFKVQIAQPSSSQALESKCHILERVTDMLPTRRVSTEGWAHINNVKLADPIFHDPAEIDLIIGADLYEEIVLEAKIHIKDSLYLRETIYGWMVTGSVGANPEGARSLHACTSSLDEQLHMFWKIETIPEKPLMTQEEKACEEVFTNTTTRDSSGRFCVKLPFKCDSPPLGDSLDQATRRFMSMERRLDRDHDLKAKYEKFVNEFIEMDHLEEIPPDQIEKSDDKKYYLPHHSVVKEASTTTKLRVVFDGSAVTSSGVSLNDTLMAGAKQQDDIFYHLTRFRFFKIALSADIAKMYRQVKLQDEDKDFHRILWRSNKTEPLKHYRMTRVTYGIKSSSHHSTRCLTEIADLNQGTKAALAIRRDMYVDDLASGAETKEEAIKLQDSLITMLNNHGFPLRKWMSNLPELVNRLPVELRETADSKKFEEDSYTITTLGLVWKPKEDIIVFKVQPLPADVPSTKRQLISDASKLFDPTGLISPVIIRFKILMQSTWTLGLEWDEELPFDLLEKWRQIRQDLSALEQLKIPRHISPSTKHNLQLHVFTDASQLAYGAAIYVRVDTADGPCTRLLTSKSRVAPLKQVSIPRLELCAAQLGVKLLSSVCDALSRTDYVINAVYGWTDSTIVLAWIKDTPRRWTCFVANRVSEIQETLPPQHWRHVATADNPADFVSRGLSPNELLMSARWWGGPEWLVNEPESWPTLDIELNEVPEEKKTQVLKAVKKKETATPLLELSRISKFWKLLRIYAYVFRAIKVMRKQDIDKSSPLSAPEIEESRLAIMRLHQLESFPKEFQLLQEGKKLPKRNRLRALTPFYDEESRVIRVGGRLAQSDYPTDMKFPILVDKQGVIPRLICLQFHLRTLHGGPTLTLATIRQQYWIISGRRLVRSQIKECFRCLRFTGQPLKPVMGDLPQERIEESRPFTNTGLDFGGPLMTKTTPKKTEKVYIALFVCFATRATHIELVSALTKEACIAALRRFIARRGVPSCIFSDNGTNFVGARNELAELGRLLSSTATKDTIKHFAAEAGMTWATIPPRTPHFGGLWEAAIRSTKKHLRRIVGTTILSFEELYTILTQIEAMLNSRPLVPESDDANDFRALTPGHFLIGAPLNALPDKQYDISKPNPQKRWQLVQCLTNHFWTRWRQEYLTTLQQRKKWQNEERNLAKGDLVLMTDENTRPLNWPLARVTKIFTGNDDQVRVVEIKTRDKFYVRPTVKLIPLLTQS